MPPKTLKPEMSAFERKRLENIKANKALLKDLSTVAQKIIPEPTPKPAGAARGSRKKVTTVKRESTRPSRSSARLSGIEADSEIAKRKAEVEAEFAAVQSKAKKLRVQGDLSLSDVVAEGKKWDKGGNDFLNDIMKGATPYQRTFTADDIRETTDKSLRALRDKMSALEIYDGYEPSRIKITPERIYSLAFHPTQDKPLVFAGDKLGNLGLFDASKSGAEMEAERNDEEEDATEPAITAFKVHTRTITSLQFSRDGNSLYSASYDSSVRALDLEKGVAIELWAPAIDEDLPISGIRIPSSEPSLIYFSSLDGAFGRYDMRAPKNTAEIWQLLDKKIGGFDVHPLHSHLISTASLEKTLKIWDLRKMTGKGENQIPTLVGSHESRLSTSHASFSAAGHIATSSYDDTIKIHHFPSCSGWKPGHEISDDEMAPIATIKHNNQTGRWVTILKPQFQDIPEDGIQKFVIGNMNRFVDVYTADGEQLAQLGGDGITAVPAVAQFHPTKDWVAGGTASGKLCLWM